MYNTQSRAGRSHITCLAHSGQGCVLAKHRIVSHSLKHGGVGRGHIHTRHSARPQQRPRLVGQCIYGVQRRLPALYCSTVHPPVLLTCLSGGIMFTMLETLPVGGMRGAHTHGGSER